MRVRRGRRGRTDRQAIQLLVYVYVYVLVLYMYWYCIDFGFGTGNGGNTMLRYIVYLRGTKRHSRTSLRSLSSVGHLSKRRENIIFRLSINYLCLNFLHLGWVTVCDSFDWFSTSWLNQSCREKIESVGRKSGRSIMTYYVSSVLEMVQNKCSFILGRTQELRTENACWLNAPVYQLSALDYRNYSRDSRLPKY